jgi:CheY-like chemotaxis protein
MSTATMIDEDRVVAPHCTTNCPALKILLTDYDRTLRCLTCTALRFDGHDVEEASDGSEMLEVMAGTIMDRDKRQFDVMVTADDLPGLPGFTILAGLRARHWDTPFILMTDDTTVQARARLLGAVVLGRRSNVGAIRSAILEAYARFGGVSGPVLKADHRATEGASTREKSGDNIPG